MTSPATPDNYFSALSRRTWVTWLWSALAAAALNLALFWVMPRLADQTTVLPFMDTFVPQVNVIRMKRTDSDVRRKPVKPPNPSEKKPVRPPDAAQNQPPQKKLTLPFEVNPRLPTGPNSLVLPPLESSPMVDMTALQGTFSIDQLDGPLTTLTRIPPVYPIQALRRGIEGWVKVSFIVDENGKVGNVSILEAEPEGLFDKSVYRCVRGWHFKPGTVGGTPVSTRVETVIRFELE